MKILHINTKDTGGAANACIRIHKSLLKRGIDSKVLVLYKTKDIPGVYQFNYWYNTKSKLHLIFKKIKYRLDIRSKNKLWKFRLNYPVEAFSIPKTIYDITKHPLYKEADIIQLNWVSGFLDESSFFKKNRKPVIWRLADLYACGGGNHYEKEFPFEAYKSLLKRNYKIREKSLIGKRMNIVAISDWTKRKVKESKLLQGNPITVISNGIDTDIFKSYDKKIARESLELPQDKKIILFGADALRVPRKGIDLLLKAVDKLKNENYFFCAFGDASELDVNHIHFFGSINDERSLSEIYSAADLFILPSIEETFGQVIIESMACGTPVVSFPTGGALDAIIDGYNGFITTDFTPDSLATAIEKALNTHFDRIEIRNYIVKNFNAEDRADCFINLYNSILNKEKQN